MIEVFNRYYGHLLSWNRISSVVGQRVVERNINIVKCFSNPQEFAGNPVVSCPTIKELSNNAIRAVYKSDLHAEQIYVLLIRLVDLETSLSFC